VLGWSYARRGILWITRGSGAIFCCVVRMAVDNCPSRSPAAPGCP